MASAAMKMMIRRVKASKMVAAGLMGNLSKVRPFCTVTPPPRIWTSESPGLGKGSGVGDEGGIGTNVKEEEERVKKEALAAARRRKKRGGGPSQIPNACDCEKIKKIAMVGLDQINQREHTNLQLVRVLGAWYSWGPWVRYDITLEATDGDGGKPNFYRVSVCDLYMYVGYQRLELLMCALLDDPSPPITYFEPGTLMKQVDDMLARLKLERLREAKPPAAVPNTNWHQRGWLL